jgi:hypothetical protein
MSECKCKRGEGERTRAWDSPHSVAANAPYPEMPDTRTNANPPEAKDKPNKAIGLAAVLAFGVVSTYLQTGELDAVALQELAEAVAALVVVYLMSNKR